MRRIFELYNEGEGLKRIAVQLNSEQAVAPKPFIRKDPMKVRPVNGWSPSTVRAILMRDLYHGTVTWNKTKKRPIDSWGQVDQRKRPESEWQRTAVEHLRIINEPLWQRVQTRRREAETLASRLTGGRLSGRPAKTATQNLLAGLSLCALCGGSLVVLTAPGKRGRVPEYVCHRHRTNRSCANAFRIKVSDLNDAVLEAIEAHALTPEAIQQVILVGERNDVIDQQVRLESEQKNIEKRLGRLVAVIEGGGDAASLVAKVRELEARKVAIEGEIAGLRPVPRLAPATIENRLAEWRRLLRGSVTQARTVLQRVLRERITFTPRPEGDGYHFEARTRFDRLFTGMVSEEPAYLSELYAGDRRGLDEIGPEDTFDGDYNRLLEAAHAGNRAEVLASPPGFEPGFQP